MSQEVSSDNTKNTDGTVYTKDVFRCGLCGCSLYSLDQYVSHMVISEQCLFVMEASTIIDELYLPRFIPPENGLKREIPTQEVQKPNQPSNITEPTVQDLNAPPVNILSPAHVSTETSESPQKQMKSKETTHLPLKTEPEETKIPTSKQPTDTKSFPLYPMCPTCGQLFKNVRSMKSHQLTVHSGERPYICSYESCGAAFATLGSLNRHRRRHEDLRPYKCVACGRAFRESGSLTRHQRSNCGGKRCDTRYGTTMPFSKQTKQMLPPASFHKLKEEQPSMPNVFDEEDEDNKTIHTYTHTHNKTSADAEDQKPNADIKNIIRTSFACPICTMNYDTNSKLLKHMKSHHDEMDQKCLVCGKRFNCPSSLARHWTRHSDTRQFECGFCEKKFKLKTHALNHLKSHSQEKTFTCPECGNSFKTMSSLNVHIKTHTNEKPFQCDICSSTFGVKSSLTRHLRVHTGDRPFICPNCNQAFKEHGTLSRHQKSKGQCLGIDSKQETQSEPASDQTDSLSVISDRDSLLDFEEFMFKNGSPADQQNQLYILSEAIL